MNPLPSAVFLDRDGTLIRDVHYVSRPDQVKLIPGAAEAVARINALLIPVIVVTNQSGIGRGLFTADDYDRVTARVAEELAIHGAHIDASYYCPHRPEDQCECRKPGDLLFHRAATEMGIALEQALLIGDRKRDVEPAISLGAHAVLVPSEDTPESEVTWAGARLSVATTLGDALDRYLCTN